MIDVSIIMPCFNSAKYLDEAVRSVVNQTFTSWELLICDDGSVDGSIQIAEEWVRNNEKILFFHNRFEKGASGARNSCLSKAKGRFIAFLDSDDVWFPKKLESQICFMKNTNSSFVFGYCENFSEKGKFLSTTKAPATVSFQKLLLSNFIPCLTVIYDTKTLGKVDQPNINKRNDYALWIRILRENQNIEARCFPEVIARYRVNKYGLSASKLSGISYFYKCLRQFAGLGRVTASFYTFSAIAFKVLKTASPRTYNIVVSKFF